MPVTGGPPLRWHLWIKKKQLQLLIRTHLSHVLAIALAGIVLTRELDEIRRVLFLRKAIEWFLLIFLITAGGVIIKYVWLLIMRKRLNWYEHLFYVIVLGVATYLGIHFGPNLMNAMEEVSLLQWLILTVTLGTLFATAWELVGDKITTSPQEIRFTLGVRNMLRQLENFCFHTNDQKVTLSLDELIDSFLTTTQTTLCGNRDVEAGFMLLQESGTALQLVRCSANANYPDQLVIPLPGTGLQTGPAGLAFEKGQLVYFPDRDWQESWFLEEGNKAQGYIISQSPVQAWVAVDPDKQNFNSGLCVPVVTYLDQGKKTVGVLNFSTKTRDPFTDRDFLMAECYASLLSQAITFREKMKAALTVTPVPAQKPPVNMVATTKKRQNRPPDRRKRP